MLKDRKLGPRHWVKVAALCIAALAITWYAKQPPSRKALRDHGTAVWIFPSTTHLSALIVAADDENTTNRTETGARLWLRAPESPHWIDANTPALYRGNTLIILDSLVNSKQLEEFATTLDTGGVLVLEDTSQVSQMAQTPIRIQPLPCKACPKDSLWGRIGADFHWIQDSLHQDLTWKGYRIRWWNSVQEAQRDTTSDPVSLGIILSCLNAADPLPFAKDKKVQTLVYCGGQVLADSSRIALTEKGMAFTLIEDRKAEKLLAKKIHLH